MKIPQKYVLKISRNLIEHGFIEAHKGRSGGLSILPEGKRASLLDIIRIMEKTVKINRCLEDDEYCSRNAQYTCPVRAVYAALQKEIETQLGAVTVEELVCRL